MKISTTQYSRYVLELMFGKSSGFLLIAFITYSYAKCIIQCISISSKFFFYQPIISCRASKLYKREIWMDGDYFIHCMIQLYVISVRLEIYENVVSLWLYPMVNFIFRAIISSNCLLQVWNDYVLFCQRGEQILHGFDM